MIKAWVAFLGLGALITKENLVLESYLSMIEINSHLHGKHFLEEFFFSKPKMITFDIVQHVTSTGG